ncbi:MAG: hypothetical protein RMJ43_12620 [Chloroherpetonaceae bacterium]|nr:hypothetical protein [Chthonomonadaceae bacterium]MDW8208673.1 hypothetical protein [Chloroherpetonaceae bacterium]
MQGEQDEVIVNYFVLCDQVITEAQTNKQSLIGVYSALMTEQLPAHANLAVALGIRVQSARNRELVFRFTAPDGRLLFQTPPLPFRWETVAEGLRAHGFATLQIGLNLRAMPLPQQGTYTAALYCDGELLATYPLSVMPAPPPSPPGGRAAR